MTLNGRNVTLAEIKKNYGAHQKNFNKGTPVLSAAKCRPVILVSRNVRHMRIFCYCRDFASQATAVKISVLCVISTFEWSLMYTRKPCCCRETTLCCCKIQYDRNLQRHRTIHLPIARLLCLCVCIGYILQSPDIYSCGHFSCLVTGPCVRVT